MTITEPGVYQMPLADYVKDPAPQPSVNAGAALTVLTQSPRHAWAGHPRLNPKYEHEESSRLDLGTIAHALLVEGDSSRVEVIEADDWKTKDARTKRDEARAKGLLPVLAADFDRVEEMIAVAAEEIAASEIACDWLDAVPEQTLIWQEEGVWCRSRPDRSAKDWRVLFDYKTSAGSASPVAFRQTALRYGYDLQAALGIRGVQSLIRQGPVSFVFIVQEIEPPYAVSFVSLDPQWMRLADDKLRTALSVWKGCLRTNEWPSYPDRIAYLEPPAYALVGWEAMVPPIAAEDFI